MSTDLLSFQHICCNHRFMKRFVEITIPQSAFYAKDKWNNQADKIIEFK